jgi:uncharacterized protein (DUF924 family)
MSGTPGASWQDVLDFWFLPADDPGRGTPRPEWFRKDPAFDASIRAKFGALIDEAVSGGQRDWERDARSALARIIVLDQFTRNTFRDTPRAFAGDALAQEAAMSMVSQGRDATLLPVERQFVYLPLEHAEDLALQERSLALFRALEASSGLTNLVDYAVRHRDIIARFGRFPHRNRILGRVSTPEEIAFLEQPGSGF